VNNTKIRRQVSPTVRHRSRKPIVTDLPEAKMRGYAVPKDSHAE
jgi:hypothetical protein